jgi:hypothetical protein
MNRRQRVVFGNMGGGRPPKRELTAGEARYAHNTIVFEISANWESVLVLMSRFSAGGMKTVDALERDWINFSLENSINFGKYNNSDEFIEDCLQKIE